MDKKIKECKKRYAQLCKLIDMLERKCTKTDEKNKAALREQITQTENELIIFVREEYAKVVFYSLIDENPVVKNIYTGALKSFAEVYGSKFETMSNGNREGLVGLIEKYGAFKLK